MSTSSNILARGIRVPRAILDAFLQSHNLPPTIPKRMPLRYEQAISALFTRLGVKGKLRLFEPYLQGFEHSDHVFLCYDWVYVLAEKEVGSSLKKDVPEGFMDLAKGQILHDENEVHIGTWVICFEQEWGLFEAEKYRDSETYRCGLCDSVMDSYETMFKHLQDVHQQEEQAIPPC